MPTKKTSTTPELPATAGVNVDQQDECVWRRPEVQATVKLPTATLYALMAAGKFPRPIQLGTSRRVGWLKTEVLEWMRSQPRSQGRVSA